MNANHLQDLIKDAIWLVVTGAATFGLWAWAVNAPPAAAQTTGQPPIQASGTLTVGQGGGVAPSGPMPITTIDLTAFPTPSVEEIATRKAILEGTHLSPPSQPPLPSQSSLFRKAPLQTGLAGTGSIAVVVLLAKFLRALALLLLGK